jgi:hypothetical protein
MGKEALIAFAPSGAQGACVDLSIEGGNDSIAHIKEHIASESSAPSSYSSYAPELGITLLPFYVSNRIPGR